MNIAQIIRTHGNSKRSAELVADLMGCTISQAGKMIDPFFTKRRPIYNIRTRKISGYALSNIRVSKHRQFCVTSQTLELFNSPHECYVYLMNGYQNNLLPRSGGNEGRPLPPFAVELYKRNVELNRRHWVWIQEQGASVRQCTGYDSVWGYGYHTSDGFVIVNSDDTVEFSVNI